MRRIAISWRWIAIGLVGGVFLLECLRAALVVGLPVVNQHLDGDSTRAVTVTGQCERDWYVVAIVVRHMYRCPVRWTIGSSYGGKGLELEGEVDSARELAPGDVVDATGGDTVPITGFALWVGYGSLLAILAMILVLTVVGVVDSIRSNFGGSGGGGVGTDGGSCGGGCGGGGGD
jgi:hypothetical protein